MKYFADSRRRSIRTISLILSTAVIPGLSFASDPAFVRSQNSWTLTDSLNRTVAVTSPVSRVLCVQPEISRMIVALGAGGTLVGMDYTLRRRDPLFQLVFPGAIRVPVVSVSANNINLELVVQLKPEIIFVSPFERQIVDTLERKIRVPVVARASMGKFDGLLEELRLVGRILGREARAAELIGRFSQIRDRIRRVLNDVPKERKPRVYLAFWESLTRTPISYEPVDAAGGRNVAAKLLPDVLGSVQTMINIEQLLNWNPDIILVHGNYRPEERKTTVRQILDDPRLASVNAVRSRKVYYTFGFWDWWDLAEVALETSYLAHKFYPDRFPDFDLKREGDAIFKTFYGKDAIFSEFCPVIRCDEWDHD